MSKVEIEAILRDVATKAMASQITESVRQAFEDHRKRELDGDFKGLAGDMGSQMARAFAEEARKGHYQFPVATGRDGGAFHDPHKGRGIVLGQLVRCLYLAKSGECNGNPAKVAEKFSQDRALPPAHAERYGEIHRALLESNYAGAGVLIPPAMSTEIIEFLYPAVVTMGLGARQVPFKGTLDMGKMNSGATVYFVGEAQNVTPSQPGFGKLVFKAHKAAVVVILSNDLLRYPSVAADTYVRDDVVRRMAMRRDLSVLRGAGTEYQPTGIKTLMDPGNQLPSAGTDLASKVQDLINLISALDTSDVPLDRGGFVMNPRSKWALAATLNGLGQYPFWPMIASGQLYGFPMATTTQVPANLGGGGGDSEIYFSQWPEVMVGEDLPLEVEMFLNGAYYDGANLVSGISTDQSVLRALDRFDVLLRHSKAAAMLTGVQY